MTRIEHGQRRLGRALLAFAAVTTVGLAAQSAHADRAVDPPTVASPQPPPTDDESTPMWMWFIPPVGLILGLTVGARLRSRHNRSRPKA